MPLPQEMKSLTNEKIPHGHCKNIANNILVCQTGVGKENTLRAIQQLLSVGVDLFISWGMAAGLSSEVAGGDLLIPDSVVVFDKTYPTNSSFNNQLACQIPESVPFHQGQISYTQDVLVSIESKQELSVNSRCFAADMESGVLAEIAAEKNIPFAVVRAVSDPVHVKIPKAIMAGIGAHGEFSFNNFLKTAIITPGEWWLIIKLARNFKKAQKTLNIAAKILKTKS